MKAVAELNPISVETITLCLYIATEITYKHVELFTHISVIVPQTHVTKSWYSFGM